MFEDELGSNPAYTNGAMAKSKPMILNKEGIIGRIGVIIEW
jgi:hypothetical protein